MQYYCSTAGVDQIDIRMVFSPKKSENAKEAFSVELGHGSTLDEAVLRSAITSYCGSLAKTYGLPYLDHLFFVAGYDNNCRDRYLVCYLTVNPVIHLGCEGFNKSLTVLYQIEEIIKESGRIAIDHYFQFEDSSRIVERSSGKVYYSNDIVLEINDVGGALPSYSLTYEPGAYLKLRIKQTDKKDKLIKRWRRVKNIPTNLIRVYAQFCFTRIGVLNVYRSHFSPKIEQFIPLYMDIEKSICSSKVKQRKFNKSFRDYAGVINERDRYILEGIVGTKVNKKTSKATRIKIMFAKKLLKLMKVKRDE